MHDKIKKTYTVTACPPNVYRMLVAPVKYNTSLVGPECVTPSAYKITNNHTYNRFEPYKIVVVYHFNWKAI